MIWQDIGIMVIQWAFFLALLPTVWSKDKPPLSTSVVTSLLLLALAFIFSTLHFWNSMASTLFVALAWVIIGFQKYRIIKRDTKYDVGITSREEHKAPETTS